jgi:hypothetical protein
VKHQIASLLKVQQNEALETGEKELHLPSEVLLTLMVNIPVFRDMTPY